MNEAKLLPGSIREELSLVFDTVTGPDGTVTTSFYDEKDRIVQTDIENSAGLDYTYDNGSLTAVTRTDSNGNTQTYHIDYDAFGSMTGMQVGSRALASYTYGPGNGLRDTRTRTRPLPIPTTETAISLLTRLPVQVRWSIPTIISSSC